MGIFIPVRRPRDLEKFRSCEIICDNHVIALISQHSRRGCVKFQRDQTTPKTYLSVSRLHEINHKRLKRTIYYPDAKMHE